ncbi:LAME_0F09450g1_1 [Lachancea meyersii CBS 8951]|uniref:LAME_0F09450g1_1 n=1 Tax=Lachancea meyersii CBS 8951 TaxID=1266667 RepID=A0A1G4JV05_9SACH|nr:LAME_0F09450g1_1 [Lachancea meyersii CBS 8951]
MLQEFIKSQCLVLQLKLAFKSASVPNEALVHKALTTELQSLGNVLYSRSNASVWQKTLKRTEPKIDLIISSNNLDALSTVLFNLRGFTVPALDFDTNVLQPDPPLSLKESQTLQELCEKLRSVWSQNAHRRKSQSRDLAPFASLGPWTFKSTPVSHIQTSAATTLRAPTILPVDEQSHKQLHGSRFFDFSRWQPPRGNGANLSSEHQVDGFFDFAKAQLAADRRHVHLEPILYSDFESLPRELQDWLEDPDEASTNSEAESEDDSRRLDFLLRGFKGFER